MMTDEAIALMKNEKACILKADTCDRNCIKCELLRKTENLLSAYDMAIKALERTKWIPCSERQPQENGNYLAFYRTSDGTASLEFIKVDHCNAGGGWLHEENGRKAYKKVIAWMPLPERYRTGARPIRKKITQLTTKLQTGSYRKTIWIATPMCSIFYICRMVREKWDIRPVGTSLVSSRTGNAVQAFDTL